MTENTTTNHDEPTAPTSADQQQHTTTKPTVDFALRWMAAHPRYEPRGAGSRPLRPPGWATQTRNQADRRQGQRVACNPLTRQNPIRTVCIVRCSRSVWFRARSLEGHPLAASSPKPDDQRVTRHAPAFSWVDLPAKRAGAAPKLPKWRTWRPETLVWWRQLWAKPQATMWEPSGASLWVLATLIDDLVGGETAAKVSSEIRAHEDRHGLSPKSLLQLRWRVVAEDPGKSPVVAKSSVAARRNRLRVV